MSDAPIPKKRGNKAKEAAPATAPVATPAPMAAPVAAASPAPPVAQPVAQPVATQPTPAPEPEKKKRGGNLPVREKDANGFAKGSKAGLIYAWLLEGKYTKDQILAGLDQNFPGANNKTTLNVFLSDLQKAVGTYSVSRGVKVVVAENGVASIQK